jgi:tryptophanyl-tRNA synthetase
MKPIILTGDRPTGPLHLGHYVGSLKNRVALQHTYDQHVLVADAQALTDNFDHPELVRENIFQVMLDYLAVGLDPLLNTFILQSQVPELYELTAHFMNLVTVARLQRNPTIKEEIKQKGFGESLPVGFFCYPISQAADILMFDADLVPVGADQNPMIEQTNEIARRFNFLYKTNCFKEVKSMVGTIGRLPGIDGKTKMSKSLGNAIMLQDSPDEIKKKVQQMYTDSGHLRVEDPGKVEGHVVFQFLDFFDPNASEVAALKEHYQRGGLGDGVLKKRLTEILIALIDPFRKRRSELAQDEAHVMGILREGTHRARNTANTKLKVVREALGLMLG